MNSADSIRASSPQALRFGIYGTRDLAVMTKLSPRMLSRLRMRSLLLEGEHPKLRSVKQIASWFGAMQAQDLASGKWSFGVRLPRKSAQDIDAAIERGDVLRTWPMRGTIHFIPAEDAQWLLKTTGVKALARAAARRAHLGLEESTVNRAADILGKALVGGRRFTRAEVLECFRRKDLKLEGQHAYHTLWYVSQIGVTCIGPNAGTEQTFVLLSDWARKQRTLSPDQALAELALRYFRSHGPVTQQDFMGWTGLSAAEAKRGIAMVERQLVALPWEGKTLLMSRSVFETTTTDSEVDATPMVRVLPGFDEYLLGIKDRSLAVPAAYKDRIIPGGNGIFMPTLVVDGVVVGTWKRTVKKREVLVEPMPFRNLTRPVRGAFEEAFAAYGQYLGVGVNLRWD